MIASAREVGKDPDLEPVHERSARKCLDLARTNGGIYNKAAQFVASLQGGAGEQVWLKISNHNISVRVPVVLSAYLHLVVQNKIEVWLT